MTEEVMKQLDGLLADLAIAHFGCGQTMGDDKRFEEYFDKAATAKKALCDFVAAQLHQGEADRERLDWLETMTVNVREGKNADTNVFWRHPRPGPALRDVIDAAKSAALSPAKETGNGGAT